MSKKNKKSNNSGYIFTGDSKKAEKTGKKLNRSQASVGSTVDQPAKKHLNIFGKSGDGVEKERLNPLGVDAALNRTIHRDRRFIDGESKKVMAAQKREDFMASLPRSAHDVKADIGGVFTRASAAVKNARAEHRAKAELRKTAYTDARKAARGAWNKYFKPTAAEKAVQG